jgi:hypothetical protein
MSGQLSYSERYAILAGRVIYADYVQRKQLIQEGRPITLNLFPPNHDASIMTLLHQGEVNTSTAELSNYLEQISSSSGNSATVPTVPLSVAVIPSNGALSIVFLPGADGGSPITNYSYSTNGTTFTPLSPADTASPLTIPGLTNGTVYTVYIKAINANGSSPASAGITAAPIPSSFNPIMIGNLRVWLDAQNSSKVITTSGIVTGWNDSSADANNFIATGAITYDVPSPINNRPALNFTVPNTTSIYKDAFAMTPGKNELTLFMIVSQTGQGTGNSELFFTKNDFRYFDLFNNTNPSQNGLLSINLRNATQLSTGVDIITTPASIVLISVAVSTTVSVYVNGALTSVNGSTANGLSLDTVLDWSISGGGFKGYVGEVITYNAFVTDDGRQKVEGYLAWKWGLQSQLSDNNPWKTAPPTNASGPGAPTLTYILPGNTVAYVYYTAGTGTAENYQFTTNSGTTYANSYPADAIAPAAVSGLTNGSSVTISLRAYNSGGYSVISNGLAITPSNPSVPAPWLLFDPNDPASYSGTGTTVSNTGSFGALNGTITGSVSYISGTGISRNVFNFIGGYINFGSFNFGTNFTITAWIYPRTQLSINTILANGFANVNTAGFKFGWNFWQTTDHNLLFESGDGTVGNWQVPGTVSNTVVMNTWQQVAVIFNRTLNISIFLVNGLPVNVGGITTASNVTVNGVFNIGAYLGGSYSMRAELGLLKVFNSSLTAAQVLADYNATRAEFGL